MEDTITVGSPGLAARREASPRSWQLLRVFFNVLMAFIRFLYRSLVGFKMVL